MSHRTLKNAGFTLVEILIVVVILGILAAIVIPQFTNASQAARASQLTAQLQTIRSQLELAQLEHQGVYPTLAGNDSTGWEPLTRETERVAAYTLADDTVASPAGPYLQKAPVNGFFTPTGAITNVSVGPDSTTAWIYNVQDGSIQANVNSLSLEEAEALRFDVVSTTNPDGDVVPGV